MLFTQLIAICLILQYAIIIAQIYIDIKYILISYQNIFHIYYESYLEKLCKQIVL